MNGPLLTVEGLTKRFLRGDRTFAAVDEVSFTIGHGETLGLVGPSGSGKSTVARLLARLIEPDAGSIRFSGIDWLSLRGGDLRRSRRRLQMVFQDPLAAFNPRATVERVVADPLRIHRLVARRAVAARIALLLERVGLDASLAARRIHEISGGQRQRVAIARSLACEPDLIVLDEAVSALDVLVRAQVLDLLRSLQRERGLAYLFVGHDLAVVAAVAHRIAVMEDGHLVEAGSAQALLGAPKSETAKALVAAMPKLRTFPQLP